AHRRRNLAEVGIALVRNRIRKIGMVEQIEKVSPELQLHSLADNRELLGGGEIEIDEARSVPWVAAGRADASGRWCGREVGLVERRINIAIVLRELPAADEIRPVVELVEAAEIG